MSKRRRRIGGRALLVLLIGALLAFAALAWALAEAGEGKPAESGGGEPQVLAVPRAALRETPRASDASALQGASIAGLERRPAL